MTADLQSDRSITDDVKSGSDRSFGVIFSIVFAVIGLWPLLNSESPSVWAIVVGVAFLGVALASPRLLAPLNRQWVCFGLFLSRFTAPVVMALVFFTTVTPIALVRRLMGKDSLCLRRKAAVGSYWIPRSPPGPSKGTMKNQF